MASRPGEGRRGDESGACRSLFPNSTAIQLIFTRHVEFVADMFRGRRAFTDDTPVRAWTKRIAPKQSVT